MKNSRPLIFLSILFCTVYTLYFVFPGNDEKQQERLSTVSKPIVTQSLKKEANKQPETISDEITAKQDEPIRNAVLPIPSDHTVDNEEVINIGEFIDVDANPADYNQSNESEEVINIGEFIDVDAEIIVEADENQEVINIGEFIDVDL